MIERDAAVGALEAVRRSEGYERLSVAEREQLERDLASVQRVLDPVYGAVAVADPFAVPFETPNDLRGGRTSVATEPRPTGTPAPSPAAAARAPAGTEVIGARARQALEAVDFPKFVAGLVAGTFQAIVDATVQQVREYARLVQSITQSADRFAQENVTPNQARDWLVEKYPRDLALQLPRTGERGTPRVVPRSEGNEPPWLADFGLGGQELTRELAEGALLQAARQALATERLQHLSTMVLMGINRIVVSDGQIRAKLNFHASAKEQIKADVVQAGAVQGGVAGQNVGSGGVVSTMVSTTAVNAQASTGIDTRLAGEVMLRFRSETFTLERFADSAAIQLINGHARTTPAPAAEAAPARDRAAAP